MKEKRTFDLTVAYLTFFFAAVTLLWKSPIGIDWIPIVGTAFNKIFRDPSRLGTDTGDGDDEQQQQPQQYPRRKEDEEFWHIIYLWMYGYFKSRKQHRRKFI